MTSLDELFKEKEDRALALAELVANQYDKRCNSFTDCAGSSYDNCVTTYPGQTCPADAIKVPACAGCGADSADAGAAAFDYTVSTVRLPAALSSGVGDNRPNSDGVAETICYTLAMDDFFVAKNAEDDATGTYGDLPPQMYFGASTGGFRIYPARHSDDCGWYDPRIRPWYVASSSGPKDVVLVLDTSGSMAQYGRAELMIDAAKAVVKTLTIADWFAVVLFNSDANVLEGSYLRQATKENKDSALAALGSVQIGGGTSFSEGFAKAFDVLAASVPMEYTSGCHRAILFLTDGENTDGTPQQVLDAIASGNAAYGATVFAYSLGSGADATLPKQIACANNGVWSGIADGADLVGSMSSYYQLFARGLGDAENEGFTAWVEPYAFSTGGIMGTTVGAPVYDRTLTPPHFIGVAAVDMTVPFLEEASGGSYQEVLEGLVRRSTARCPALHLGTCVLQALRLSTGGLDSVCSADELGTDDDCMTSDNTVERRNGSTYDPPSCMTKAPRDVWANTDLAGASYRDRACCVPGESEAGCAPAQLPAIIGGAVGGAVVVFCLIICCYCSNKKGGDKAPKEKPIASTAMQPVVVSGQPVTGSAVPMGTVMSNGRVAA